MHSSNDRLLRATLELAWAQWTAVGVAGVGPARSTVVDPEALLVASAEFGRWDARLFAEMLDWLVVNGATVDLARLKRLLSSQPSEVRRLVAAIVEFVADRGDRRARQALLPGGADDCGTDGSTPPQTLFSSRPVQTGGGETWGEVDEVFLARGFVRNPPVLRGMSQRPDAASPACVRFRARALTGVGARAEALTYLWTHEWAHGRLIADRAAYSKSTVAQYLSDLYAAKLTSRRGAGRRVLYRLEPDLAALGRPAGTYVDWAAAWRGVATIWRELRDWPAGGERDHARVSRLASALTKAAPDLAAEGFDVHVPELRGWAASGADLPLVVADGVAGRLFEFVE
jgi:DNA-binding transcriptional ArsR family regulator